MKKITLAKIEDWIGFSKLPPFLKDGFVISTILHVFFLVLIMVSPYIRIHTNTMPMVKFDEPIIVDLDNLVIDKKTNIIAKEKPVVNTTQKQEEKKVEEKKVVKTPPAPAKEEKVEKKSENFFTPEVAKKDKEEKAPEVKDNKKTTKDNVGDFIDTEKKPEEKKVEPKKDEKKPDEKKEKKEPKDLASERMGGLDDLLASVDGMKRTKNNIIKKEIAEAQKTDVEKTTEIKKGIESADLGDVNVNKTVTSEFMKKTMAISYIDAVRVKLRSCWHLDSGAKGVKDMKIVLRTSLSPDGNVNNIEILNQDEYASSPWFKAVADSARRALIVCSPYNLPVEFYKEWKDIVFTFYPDKKSVQ